VIYEIMNTLQISFVTIYSCDDLGLRYFNWWFALKSVGIIKAPGFTGSYRAQTPAVSWWNNCISFLVCA